MSQLAEIKIVDAKNAEHSINPTKQSLLSLIPQYFIGFIALLYASGFLVTMAFFDRYGIRESGSDLWKARYIHIGILVLSFPFIINATVFSLRYIMQHPRADLNVKDMRARLWPILLLLINLEITCYMIIMLTSGGQPGSPAVGLHAIQWILGITLIGVPAILLIERFTVRFINNFTREDKKREALNIPHKLTVFLRWLLIPVIASFDIWFIVDFVNHLGGMIIWLVCLYLGFSLIFGIIFGTLIKYEKRPTVHGNIIAYRVMGACLSLPLFYLMLLSFAYGVYPYIPAPRGGGDFNGSPKIIIHWDNSAKQIITSASYLDQTDLTKSKPLILLEETQKGIYVADPLDAGGPSKWRTVGGRKPRLLFIGNDTISNIEFESRSP